MTPGDCWPLFTTGCLCKSVEKDKSTIKIQQTIWPCNHLSSKTLSTGNGSCVLKTGSVPEVHQCQILLIPADAHHRLSLRRCGFRVYERWCKGGVWGRHHTFLTAPLHAMINRRLQEVYCALALCQGQTIYPANDFEVRGGSGGGRGEEGGGVEGLCWAGLPAGGSCSVVCQHLVIGVWWTVEVCGWEGWECVLSCIPLKHCLLFCTALKNGKYK